jgi:hypothetical protein
MSTVARSRGTSAPSRKTRSPGTAHHRRRLPFFTATAIGILLLVWFAPAIAVRSGLLEWGIAWSLGQLPGRLTIGGAALGWLSPVELTDVALADASGHPLFEVPSASSELTLARLLWSQPNHGTVRLNAPTVHITLRDGGSNLEDFLSQWPAVPSARPTAAAQVLITGARLIVTDVAGGLTWNIHDLNVTIVSSTDSTKPIQGDLAGTLSQGDHTARFTAKWCGSENPAGSDPIADSPATGSGDVSIHSDGMPLAVVRPLLRRFLPQSDLTGDIRGEVACQWQCGRSGRPVVRIMTALGAQNVRLTGPWRGRDQLDLANLELSCRIEREESFIRAHSCGLTSDIGNVTLQGELPCPSSWDAAGCVVSLAGASGVLEGHVDLAGLARLFPEGLRLREGTEIVSGQAHLHMVSDSRGASGQVRGRIETTSLVARTGGREFAWEQPLEVRWVGRSSADRFVMEQFTGRSDFLEVSGSGTADGMEFNAAFDLGRLATEIGRFADVGGWDVSGTGRSKIALQRRSAEQFQCRGQLEANELRLTHDGRPVWSEHRLDLLASAAATLRNERLERLEAGTLELSIDADHLSARLKGPVERPSLQAAWPVEVAVQGGLARWLLRFGPLLGAPVGWQIDGRGNLRVDAESSDQAVRVRQLQLVVDDLQVAVAGGQPWRQKQVLVNGRGEFHRREQALEIAELGLVCDIGQLNAGGRMAALSSQRECQFSGQVDYDLEQLTQFLQPRLGDAMRFSGRQSRSFSVAGPLVSAGHASPGDPFWLQGMRGRAEFGWHEADLFGFRLGAADTLAEWSDGVVRISPVKLDVNDGTVTLAPTVRLAPAPSELFLSAGPLVEGVKITPEMCQRGLKYVAPVLADVTQAEGRLSIQLDGCRVPLADPSQCDAAGRVIIHSVQIGPGPLVRELAQLLGHAAPISLVQESEIPFRVYQGRIYHENVGLVFPDVTVKTRGSVGFDQTLALLAEMPVPRRWVGSGPVAEALSRQVIRVPIAGTLHEPRLDRREVERLSAEFLRQMGGDLLREQLGRELERLLKPRNRP